MVTVALKGIHQMMESLKNATENIRETAAAALFIEGNIEMTESKHRCPLAKVDGGVLRSSGQVSDPIINGNNIKVILSYGGAASDYAIAVHEHLSVHSPYSWRIAELEGDGVSWHTPGTGPKFLESVLNESESSMLDRVSVSMKRRFSN